MIGVDIYHYTTDMPTLIPFIRKVQQDYHGVIQNVVADSGYASEKNYDFLERNRSQIYIPYQSYYQEKTRKFRQDIGKRQNMAYDSERDVYRCANNRELVYSGTDYDKRDAEYPVKKKVYRCTDCHDCPLRRQCMPYSKREDTNKTVSYSENFERQKQRVYSNLTSEHGIRLRMNRSIQTEGFFGIMKEDYHFRRFLLRGTEKVRVEVLSLAFAFNFRRLYNKQRAGLNGTFIEYEVKEAA